MFSIVIPPASGKISSAIALCLISAPLLKRSFTTAAFIKHQSENNVVWLRFSLLVNSPGAVCVWNVRLGGEKCFFRLPHCESFDTNLQVEALKICFDYE